MSYEAAQHVLTAAFNALATTPLLVAVIKMSLALMFPATVQPAATVQVQPAAQDDTSWESIWATADEIGARYEDGGVYAPEPALIDDGTFAIDEDGTEYALDVAPSSSPSSDYGAIVGDLAADSAAMGLATQTAPEWSIAFAEDLMSRKKADLLATASKMGLRLSAKLNKAAIVAAIVTAPAC